MIELDADTVQKLLDRVSYKRNFRFHVRNLRHVLTDDRTILIEAEMDVEDTYRLGRQFTGRVTTMVPDYLHDEAMFYEWFAHWLIQIERHESQEWFRVDGKLFDDPHANERTTL